ncbi:MAG: prenyltransferase [Nocardioidaceae bacterium]
MGLPALPGVVSAEEIAATAAALARIQQPDGGVPWAAGDPHIDPWNHVEAAMAMLVGGEVEAAELAYQWWIDHQRPDGSLPMRITGGVVEDPSGDTNMTAYVAVGVWHHWLVRRDLGFVRRLWPHVRLALDYAADRQLPFGGIAWSQEYALDGNPGSTPGKVNEEALVAGSASIHHALLAGVALGELLDDPRPDWGVIADRLRDALSRHRDLFLDKSNFSMDWYYPVLGGAVRGEAGRDLIASRWDEFVQPGAGIRCVVTNPWFTGAETCELALALDALGERTRAVELVASAAKLRHENGLYWTGIVLPEQVHWPDEQTTYTAAAFVLAVDALSDTTPGAQAWRQFAGARRVSRLWRVVP